MLRAKNINPLVSVPSSLRENIREDLYVLQASQSRYLFNTAVKWSTKNKAIVKSRLPTIVYLLVVIQWLHSKCSCQHWMKNYFCYHDIYIAVNHRLAQFLDIHMTIPLILRKFRHLIRKLQSKKKKAKRNSIRKKRDQKQNK